MSTPEQHREYIRLSGLLQQVCRHHMRELPKGTTSVLLTNEGHEVRVQAFDGAGKAIGTVPNENTSAAFRADLTRAFANVIFPDPNGVVAPL